jgi:kinesin family protein 11
MAFARKGSVNPPPLSRNNNIHQATGGSSSSNNIFNNSNNGAGSRALSRPTSKNSLHVAYGAAGGGGDSRATSSSFTSASTSTSADGPGSSTSVPHRVLTAPASPTKERMRQMGLRPDGIGGSHLKQKGDEETNIQVVVRIRGMAPGEPPAHQPILSTSGPHCSSIKVAMETPQVSSSSTRIGATATSVQSSLVNDAPAVREKTYNFDHVFAPEADQGMVYQSVVVPVLNEVMSGYNCTIFAYGQTGTGKTHTMEGDLTESMGTYSSEAGVIPRTLYRLFHTLELSRDEYSVHASFVELYNEELRDLLSNDAPQPLGGGSNSTGLRMFEDSRGRGVVIQGLEETPMKDAKHGLKLLQRGSQKRQIAATKCNESSSRSHSIFSLTVHIKETTSKGEDVLRTGKLNLVDLAGSENIGRSGAENKRAREAGMINQSLLTLGRVINALVEKSSHVPYRESKLTRLLQESLGGRTKTCIIATVSSERSNMEETLSTLDYALRAKSIRNRPEVNQQMTRAALIKEYVNEIERLKGDLLATREKNGIYISPENWQTMTGEHESVKGQLEEMRRNGTVVESRMTSLKEQFEQNMQLLVKREAEAKNVKAEYKDKEEELQRMLVKMDELRKAEVEEKTLREAYMRSEKKLHRIAGELQGVVRESTSDVVGLFDKLGESCTRK